MRQSLNNSFRTSFLLRMYNLFFTAAALLPLLVLFYIYYQLGEDGELVTQEYMSFFLIITATTSLFLFVLLRNLLSKIVVLNDRLRTAVFEKIDKTTIIELTKEKGEVAELAKTFNDMMGKLEDNIKMLEHTKRTLHDVLARVGKALTSIENFDSLVALILETTIESLAIKKGVVFALNEAGGYELKASVGLENLTDQEILNSVATLVDAVLKDKKSLAITYQDQDAEKKNIFGLPLVCFPLISKNKVWGLFFLGGKEPQTGFTPDEMNLMNNLSCQVAISFENMALNKDVEKTYFETMAALALAVEAKDPYSRGHSEMVSYYSVKIAEAMGLPEKEIKALEDAGKLHDIGKIGVSDKILNKPGPLTIQEREIIKKHPVIGEGIVRPLKTFNHLLGIIRHHHEYLDGSGYPDGLVGDQLSVTTRIITVADIYDALMSDRIYRPAFSVNDTKGELNEMVRQGKIDEEVVNALFKLIDNKKL